MITEGLRPNDLEYLVSNYISVDQYTSKLDDDNITVAFFCNEMDVANDLRDFIEKNFYIEIKDVEISDSLTEDNKYILFVELERNINFPKLLMNIIDSVDNVTNNSNWAFKTFGMDKKLPLTLDNIQQYVRLSKLRHHNASTSSEETVDKSSEENDEKTVEKNDKAASGKVKESFEPIVLNDYGWKRVYKPLRYISEEELTQYIGESKSINSRDYYEIQLFENKFPDAQIISTDSNVFVIKNNKILMIGQ